MQRIWLLPVWLAGAFLLAGCDKPIPVMPNPPVLELEKPFEPTKAQAKLATLRIYLGAETLDAELALTREQVATGMMFRTNLTDADAMLFVFGSPHRAGFWMKNCPESLSAAYIDPTGAIAEIVRLEANNTNSVNAVSDNIQYVLEVKEGWFQRHNIAPGAVIRTDCGTLVETFFRKN